MANGKNTKVFFFICYGGGLIGLHAASSASMAASFPAAACGHTAPDAVTCQYDGGWDCEGSACLGCAKEGRAQEPLGELPGGAQVFRDGADPYSQCILCSQWDCPLCRFGWDCDSCAHYTCEKCWLDKPSDPAGTPFHCKGCGETSCQACSGDKQLECAQCRITLCTRNHAWYHCSFCDKMLCEHCNGGASASPTCDQCGASDIACWRCRPAAYKSCVVCLTSVCAQCCAAEAAGGGGGGGGAPAGACALCEAFRCGACAAARAPLAPCPACAAALCSGCVPRHRCSAAKRARPAE